MYTIKTTHYVEAPIDIVWDVVADVANYSDFAPNINRVDMLTEGEKPARRCYDNKGRGWNETCEMWHEGHEYSYRVDTTAPDYPYPFKQLKGTWRVEPHESGTQITMIFEYIPKALPFTSWLVHRITKHSFTPVIEKLYANWEAEIQERVLA